MTEAMTFLQKAILLSYDPLPFRPGGFFFCVISPASGRHACMLGHFPALSLLSLLIRRVSVMASQHKPCAFELYCV